MRLISIPNLRNFAKVIVRFLLRKKGLFLLRCSIALSFFINPVAISWSEEIGFKENLFEEQTAWNAFEQIYVYSIDLREMLVEDWDDEEEEYFEEGINSRKLQEIAQQIYHQFSYHLKEVMPVTDGDVQKGEEGGLIIDLKLSAKFNIEDRGVLTNLLLNEDTLEKEPTMVTIECQLSESYTGEKILLLSDQHALQVQDRMKPFSDEEDLLQLTRLLDIWAKSLANYITNKRS